MFETCANVGGPMTVCNFWKAWAYFERLGSLGTDIARMGLSALILSILVAWAQILLEWASVGFETQGSIAEFPWSTT